MQNVKHKIISFWLTHIFLRRIAKRYPEYFDRWIKDITDDNTKRKIMELRYTGDNPMKFEAIAYELNIAPRRVFEKHKSVIDRIIGDI
jgi:hypothetical protein